MKSKTSMLGSLVDLQSFRKDFPILGTMVNGKPLVYMDNAATTLKPQQVVDRITKGLDDAGISAFS